MSHCLCFPWVCDRSFSLPQISRPHQVDVHPAAPALLNGMATGERGGSRGELGPDAH